VAINQSVGRILVIDDDEVVLEAIRDILEGVGYVVFTQVSPIGATQLVQRESIDGALVDLNLPDLQGDSVVRLFRSWDKLRDMPLVVVSGASREKLASVRDKLGVEVVRKDEMHTELVPTLSRALQKGRGARANANEVKPQGPKSLPTKDHLFASFSSELAQASLLTEDVWTGLKAGHFERVPRVVDKLSLLEGQAQLLGNAKLAGLLRALRELLQSIRTNTVLGGPARRCVDDAIAALRGLQRSRDATFSVSPDSLIESLRSVKQELSASV
jgi:CheY-like chemotaxis protein